MRISDWSSDVCSSDLTQRRRDAVLLRTPPPLRGERHRLDLHRVDPRQTTHAFLIEAHGRPIGLADPLFFLKLHQPGLQALASVLLVHKRSEERRVGKECVSKCRSRWSQYL